MMHLAWLTFLTFGLLLGSATPPAGAAGALKLGHQKSANDPDDPLFDYQWGLKNLGQSYVVIDENFIETTTQSDPRVSIGWQNFDQIMKADVLVATIDSGVDLYHPDLKPNLVPGVNFLSTRSPGLSPPDDDIGHGTHVASIIAASSNNQIGISGLSNRIRILPLKVFGREGTGVRSQKINPPTDDCSIDASQGPTQMSELRDFVRRVTRALDQAIERKARVVNLSLGWPRSANTPEVEDAFARALAADIVIVAGAGNDHHQAQVFPCGFAGVICVGAIGIDGKLWRASNFGGHVDLLAPGEAILGLWPTFFPGQAIPVTLFGPRGYEIMSGTSQASPFVAGAAAILRGIYPHESAQEIRHRLLASAQRSYKEVNFGLLNIEAAISFRRKPRWSPTFKGRDIVVIDPTNLTFRLPIQLEGSGAGPDSITITSQSAGVSLEMEKRSSPRDSSSLRALGRLSSLNVHQRLHYRIQVDGESYDHEVLMVRDLIKSPHLKLSSPHHSLFPLSDPLPSKRLRFWNVTERKGGGIDLSLWSLHDHRWLEARQYIKGVDRIVGFDGLGLVPVDFDFDGNDDFLLSGVQTQRNGCGPIQEIRYLVLDQNLQPKLDLPLLVDETLLAFQSPKDIYFGALGLADGRKVKVPVSFQLGRITSLDKDPDFFNFSKNNESRRVYFLEPILDDHQTKKSHFRTRTLTGYSFDKFIRHNLNLTALDDVNTIGLKTQSIQDIRLGRLKLMLSVGRGLRVNTYELVIDDLLNPFQSQNLRPLDAATLDLSRGLISEAWSLAHAAELDRTTELQTGYSRTSHRSLIENGQGFRMIRIDVPPGEVINSTIKSFVRGNDHLTLLETNANIRAIGHWNGRGVHFSAPVNISTFLPGQIFSESFVPVLVGTSRRPGVMMDHTRFFSRSVSVFSLNSEGQMLSPVRTTYQIPPGCRAGSMTLLNPIGFSQMLFHCRDSDSSGATGHILIVDLE